MGMKLATIMFILMCAMGGGFYWYYNDTQERMVILIENKVKLEDAVATNEVTIASLQQDYAAIAEENNRINREYSEIRRQNNRLAERLSDVDLGLLAAEKPESIERAINRGTENAARCFELLSGAELTEDERNATSGESFNKECPWLWPGSSADGVQSENASTD